MDPEYKKLHEEFVSNSNGTTPEEIVFISCSIPLSLLIVEFTSKIANSDKSSFRYTILPSNDFPTAYLTDRLGVVNCAFLK